MNNKRKKIEGLGRVGLVLSCLVGMEKTRAAVVEFTPGVVNYGHVARVMPDYEAPIVGLVGGARVVRPLPAALITQAARVAVAGADPCP